MASQSAPNSTGENPSNPASDGQTREEAANEISPESVFVNSQPVREEQVQNAVKFLSHPKVRGSPVIHRRNFLERKGLTKEEIDEAFRRVPDPSPAYTSVETTSTNQDGQLKPSANIPQQTPAHALQPSTAAPPGLMSTVRRQFHWSHAFLAVGFLAASGAGTAIIFKKSIIPWLKSWIRKVVFDQEDDLKERTALKPSLAEEAAAAAKAAAAAASDVAKASQEMLITKNEEKKCFEEFMNLLDVQLQEIKTMRNAMQKLEGQTVSMGKNPQAEEYLSGSLTRSKQSIDAKGESDSRSVRSSSPAPSAEPPHPKSYMEIMAMIQRGERPPNIREINDLPPNPNQPISNPSLAPRSKPWEVSEPPNGTGLTPRPQGVSDGSSSMVQDNGITYQINGNSSAAWWQQKNVRITEIENEDGFTTATNGMKPVDQPPQRKWVPPQPPPVALPEAALAIRQPKSSVPRDRLVDDVKRPVNETDELERITKISELGGQVEVHAGGSEISSTEIQEEQVTA